MTSSSNQILSVIPLPPSVLCTVLAVPLSLRFGGQVNATEVEPLYRTVLAVTGNHVTVGDLNNRKDNNIVINNKL